MLTEHYTNSPNFFLSATLVPFFTKPKDFIQGQQFKFNDVNGNSRFGCTTFGIEVLIMGGHFHPVLNIIERLAVLWCPFHLIPPLDDS